MQTSSSSDVRREVQRLLDGTAKHSVRVGKIVALLRKGNPFTKVLAAIQNTIKIIQEEAKADAEKLDWCNTERTENDATIKKKTEEINTLQNSIGELKNAINNPETGLIARIAELEKTMEDNRIAEEKTVEMRKEEISQNNAYTKDADTSLDLLDRAIKVLEKFYVEAFKKESLLQGTSPDPPSTGWESGDEALGKEYAGQREGATGAGGVIELLNTIKTDLQANLDQSHADEISAQDSFEDAMTQFTTDRQDNTKTLTEMKDEMAQKQEQLVEETNDLRGSIKVKNETEAYLLSIKEGCDFFTENMDAREDYREKEIASLQSAIALLEETPVFKQAVQRNHEENLGKCLEKCRPEGTAECQACLEKVTVAAYCAKSENKSVAGC